jgi:antitoxin (DNA-binding transcriptional repressor) of toxin-antitoxin stability system
LSVTETRVHFGEVLTAVDKRGDHIIAEKGGRRVAAIVPIQELDQYWDA